MGRVSQFGRNRTTLVVWGLGAALVVIVVAWIAQGLVEDALSGPRLAARADIDAYLVSASHSARGQRQPEYRVVLEFLRTLGAEQLDTMKRQGGLPFPQLRPSQQGLLLNIVRGHPILAGADLSNSKIRVYLCPAKRQFEWHVTRSGKDDYYAVGL